MKGMKGRFLKKIKTISSITAVRHGSFFQVNPSNQSFHTSAIHKELLPSCISVPETVNQVRDEEIDSVFYETENSDPPSESKVVLVPVKSYSEIQISVESGSTDVQTVPSPSMPLLKESDTHDVQPNLSLKLNVQPSQHSNGNSGGPSEPMNKNNEEHSTLSDFEDKCPPGGNEAVILYTTSLRGIRKTFEDCRNIRFLLESFQLVYQERDVSMHLEFREELWRILGGRIVPPRLFIKGRLIGGADEVIILHERGQLRKLLHGIPAKSSSSPCTGCGGLRFVVCLNCNGSRKVMTEDVTSEFPRRCPECNENGLIKCPTCC
ncbi:hypothetical protein NMG60_11008633 [Bertholletia excelsa]